MRQKQIKSKMVAVNKKLKRVILQQFNVISLLLLQMLAVIENYQYSRIIILRMIGVYYIFHGILWNFWNSRKHFMRLVKLWNVIWNVLVKSSSLFFLKINEDRAYYQIFIRGWKKCWLYGKFEIFIPDWNFISVKLHRVEFSTHYAELKFLHVITMSF